MNMQKYLIASLVIIGFSFGSLNADDNDKSNSGFFFGLGAGMTGVDIGNQDPFQGIGVSLEVGYVVNEKISFYLGSPIGTSDSTNGVFLGLVGVGGIYQINDKMYVSLTMGSSILDIESVSGLEIRTLNLRGDGVNATYGYNLTPSSSLEAGFSSLQFDSIVNARTNQTLAKLNANEAKELDSLLISLIYKKRWY